MMEKGLNELVFFRIGKAGTLTVERDPKEAPLMPVTGKTRGTHTVMELNPLTAKFFIGGVPTDATVSQIPPHPAPTPYPCHREDERYPHSDGIEPTDCQILHWRGSH